MDPKKQDFYKKEIITYRLIRLFLRQLICIEPNICNFALITEVHEVSFSDVQVQNGRCSVEDRKEGREEGNLGYLRVFTKVVFLDLHVASRHRSYFKASMHACTRAQRTHAAWPHSSRKV